MYPTRFTQLEYDPDPASLKSYPDLCSPNAGELYGAQQAKTESGFRRITASNRGRSTRSGVTDTEPTLFPVEKMCLLGVGIMTEYRVHIPWCSILWRLLNVCALSR